MTDETSRRAEMVERQLGARGISDPRVLDAFRAVPREAFVPAGLREFAYRDTALPIESGQTISQPYIVALTVEGLGLRGGERVLEIGTGSGYAAAVMSRLAREVFTVERHEALADAARARLAHLGYDNVHVLCGDGTLGWLEHAPYDAIAVAAGGPHVPPALVSQLAVGGRLVMPVGGEAMQTLRRVTKVSATELRQESLTPVQFVPLIGEQGWPNPRRVTSAPSGSGDASVATLIRETAEPITDLESPAIDALLERVGDARVVLLGEATHGTSEFYRLRAAITRRLIERFGFDFIAVEADWPDAARVDDYVLGDEPRSSLEFTPFARFPTWMWRNQEVVELVEWLRAHNLSQPERTDRAGFHGLDLYSLFTSIAAVLAFLDDVDPDTAQVARARYGALTPWQRDPAAYGRAVLTGSYQSSEIEVVTMLREMLARRLEYTRQDGERYFDAAQNAKVVANAERYYRAMYYGGASAWNLRDTHMFETLQALLELYGPKSRGIVWAHNSHVGNARATEMSNHGEVNVGQLCREAYGSGAHIIGFGTDHGTVAAASSWNAPMQNMWVRSAHPQSYERLCHEAAVPAFVLHLRDPERPALRQELRSPRLERAIGVIYRPDTELQSHYFHASLPHQFDELVWFDETRAIAPLEAPVRASPEVPETYPFGL